jgi:hypothetical protein
MSSMSCVKKLILIQYVVAVNEPIHVINLSIVVVKIHA